MLFGEKYGFSNIRVDGDPHIFKSCIGTKACAFVFYEVIEVYVKQLGLFQHTKMHQIVQITPIGMCPSF